MAGQAALLATQAVRRKLEQLLDDTPGLLRMTILVTIGVNDGTSRMGEARVGGRWGSCDFNMVLVSSSSRVNVLLLNEFGIDVPGLEEWGTEQRATSR